MMTVKEGERIIRIKTADGSASMSSVFIFLSQDEYQRYRDEMKKLRNRIGAGEAPKEFDVTVTGSFTPRPGDTLIEWSMQADPNAQAPVLIVPVQGSPGKQVITVPLIKGLDIHFSHPVVDDKR